MRSIGGLMIAVVACANGAQSAAPKTPTSTAATACAPTRSVAGGPITDPNGPFFHQVVIARTTDGTTLTAAHQVLDHASVPDGVRRADGTVLIYYINAQDGAIWVARIEGDSARVLSAITLDGVTAPASMVDPDAALLPDGRIRLSYLGGLGSAAGTTRAMCIADSDDGIRFTLEATALTFAAEEIITDPSVIRLPDGSSLMAMSAGQRTIIARSSDGLTFAREATLSYGGVPELALLDGGAVRLYVCAQGIESYRSTDAGRTWTREGTVVGPSFNGRKIVCDPSLVAGAEMFVFKTGS